MRPYSIIEDGKTIYKKNIANMIIPMESFTQEEVSILEDENAKWTKEMDKKFKKLIKVLEILKKIDGRISEDNLFQKVNIECEWLLQERVKGIVAKIFQKQHNAYWEKMELVK